MCHLDMVPYHIGQWNSPHLSNELEVKDYVLHSLCPVVLINLRYLKVFCLLLLQLLLVLVYLQCSAIDTINIIRLEAAFH